MIATDTRYPNYIKPRNDYIYLLEHIEPAMTLEQLNRVIVKHNNGMHYKEIAFSERRIPLEIIVALMHQATTFGRENRGTVELTRPFNP